MQHNVHAARPAPHIRAHHHTHGHTHMQMHPSLEQHLAAAASMAGAPQMQPQQQPTPHRDHHHPRLNHHHLHAQQQQQQQTPSNPTAVAVAAGPAYHHNSNISSNSSSNNNNNQMQKIRQQHQHLSSSNGHVGKCQQPPPQAYNPLAGNPAALSYNPLPPPPPPHHMAAHIGGYAAHPPHYYQMSQPKPPSKYNNNNNNNPGGHYIANSGTSNGYGSKAILQATYRSAKVGPVLAPAMVPEAVAVSATSAPSAAAAEHPECVSSSNLPVATEPTGLQELPQSDLEPITTETAATAVNEGSSIEHIDAAGTLSNEDGSSGRSGKDKTPMCLVNELARYNKITHQYRLTGERGPAHCKTFTVTLKLGDEEYSADGFKIKKAQHMAASRAIEETKYKHPPPKIRRSEEASTTRTHITPTVELNALAMKLGQRTYYLLDPTQMQPIDPLLSSEYGGGSLLPTPPPGMPQPMPQPLPPPFALRPARHGHSFVPIQSPPMHPHGFYGGPQRAYGPKYASRYTMVPPLGPHMIHGPNMPYAPIPPTPSKITLYVGKQKFVGIGRTLQQAKHDAAARALQVLKTQASSASEEALDDSMDEGDKKSPISQVHEIGIKRNMTVHFKVLREDGPAHMKNFITACVVGSIVTEGEGNGKKVSKKRSAEKMLTELQKLPPLTPTKQTPVRRIKVKTPGKNGSGTTLSISDVVSMAKPERRKRLNVAIRPVELDDAENPITKLIQLQQTRKEKEPIFELIAKNGNEASRRREFVMEVSANGTTARGTGSSKKLAKRSAAQALLELLESDEHRSGGVQESQDSTDGNATEVATATATSAPVIESTVDPDIPMVSTPVGPMPGILILRQHKRPPKRKVDPMIIVKDSEEAKEEEDANKETSTTTTDDNSSEPQPMETAPESTLNTSTGSNTSGVSSNSSNAAASSSAAAAVHMKEQLLYLSKLFEFEVNFSDYPKGNHNEFLTIVTLSTNPPQICHGVGKSSDESQNDAARNALKILSELGLNNAKK
ncbi:maternal effect protein staufen-like isoform X2 [Drosophila guanche]|uniref:Blast:Maternal effect protein staufen n=1 Tax=Drosophila guanche TaxID=7266 RepID=A0A3B0IZG2_DROGU|nr:maternal effect protein staufen-like isoform X2 [Drosophila guanche]XP_034142459.1 maternal effect protein staufen-like isoform X2 [Drosophila guanche]SPP73575.1 blast:Maternal effect protein staufen [Drosophila guanche]